MDEELVKNIVMDEELVQNVAMDEQFVKNFVMGVNIDPKFEKGLSIFKIGGWKFLQLNNRELMEEFIEEAVLQLTGILSRDSFSAMHYAGTSTRESLHVMMLCYKRQHFAANDDRHEHPRRHSSWKESTRMNFMNTQMEYS